MKIHITVSVLLAMLLASLRPVHANPSSDAAVGSGVSLMKQGRYKEAKDVFTSVQSSDPFDAPSLYYLALCNHKLGDFKRASSLYADVVAKFPDTQPAQYAAQGLQSVGSHNVNYTPGFLVGRSLGASYLAPMTQSQSGLNLLGVRSGYTQDPLEKKAKATGTRGKGR